MKKLLLCIVFVLTGCGGGGGTTPEPAKPISPAYSTPASIPDNKMRLTRIDYRYDTPTNERDVNGNQTTSFASVKPMIDQIKSVGFNGVVIQLQTPVSAKTGAITYFDQTGYDKHLPKDLSKVIAYAKEQQLKVWLSLQIVDVNTDLRLIPDFTLYTERTLFDNIKAFQKAIAIDAEKNKLDGIFISEGSCELHPKLYAPYWADLISEVRTVFAGKISYVSYCGFDIPIWEYVDYIGMYSNEPLSLNPIKDLKTIVDLYANTANGRNLIELFTNLSVKYNKKIIFFTAPLVVDSGVGADPPTFWDMIITSVWGTSTYTELSKYINYEMQQLKIKAFFEVIGRDLPNVVDGLLIDGYGPWVNNVAFSNPNNAVYLYYCCGSNLTFNEDAQKVINSYFSQPWAYHTVK